MNLANRVVVGALAAAAALACLAALAVMTGLVVPDWALFGGAVDGWMATLAALEGTQWVLWALLFMALFVLSAAIVGLELLPGRAPAFLVATTETGDVTVERRTVRDFVEHVALGVSGVRAVRATVRMRGAGLAIGLKALVETRAVVPELAAELREAVSERVEGQLSLPVHSVDVRARMQPRTVRKPIVK